MIESRRFRAFVLAASATIVASLGVAPAGAWEPTRNVEFIVPAGTGGGADQMARMIQGIVAKHNLMKQTMVVVNKAGGAGGEGFLDIKGAKGNPNKLVITLSNLFTTPLATGIPFSWKDMTPVSMLALDEFVLWVNADSPYKTVQEYVAAVKAAPNSQFKMGGTGSKQEDQIITVALEKAIGKKMTYVPYKGGGEVAVQLVGKHIDSTVNNPIEAVAQWRAGKLRPLASAGLKRIDLLPSVPTMREAMPPGFTYETWQALFTPAATPRHVLELLNREFVRMLNEADTREFLEKNGSAPRPRSLAAAREFVREEALKAVELVKAIGATAQ